MRTPEIIARLQGKVKKTEIISGIEWTGFVRPPIKLRTLLQITKRRR